MILKKDLDAILLAISQYINVNNITDVNLSNHLRHYLIEVYECDLIKYNPINKHYKLEVLGEDVLVTIKLNRKIIKFTINKTHAFYKYGE